MINATEQLSPVREAFNFEVVKMPLFGPENMKTGVYGLFRDDTGAFVGSGSVSNKYTPHTSEDVIALAEAAQHAFDDDIVPDCHFRDGHYVTISPNDSYRRSIYGTSDNIFPRVVIRAGLDKESFRATMGFYRDACMNLAMLRMVEGTTVTIRHTSGLRAQMNELIEQFSVLKQSWGNIETAVRHMQSRDVLLNEFLDAVYGQPDQNKPSAVTRHENRTKAIMNRVLDERMKTGRPLMGGNFQVSAWEAFNAVQGYAQHVAPTRGSVDDFDRILRANDPSSSIGKHVAKAEELAMTA